MISEYGFNAEQTEQLNEMMCSEYDTMWAQLLGGYSSGTGEIIISNSAENIPKDIFAWALPESYTITSPFGYRFDPFTGKTKFHGGLDIDALPEHADSCVSRTSHSHGLPTQYDSCGYGHGHHIKIKHTRLHELHAH